MGRPNFPQDEWGHPQGRNEIDYVLSDLVKRPKQSFSYEYDFGDGWSHNVTLMSIRPEPCRILRVLAGERACPPENSGGALGYAHLLEKIANANHPEHREMMKWYREMTPPDTDPEHYPIDQINARLARGINALVRDMTASEEEEDWSAFLDRI